MKCKRKTIYSVTLGLVSSLSVLSRSRRLKRENAKKKRKHQQKIPERGEKARKLRENRCLNNSCEKTTEQSKYQTKTKQNREKKEGTHHWWRVGNGSLALQRGQLRRLRLPDAVRLRHWDRFRIESSQSGNNIDMWKWSG